MREAADVLARSDAILVLAAVVELRAELAGDRGWTIVQPLNGSDTSDLADGDLIDTHSAASRFGYPADSIRKWCREENLGVRRGGRWLVSVPRLRARLNGRE